MVVAGTSETRLSETIVLTLLSMPKVAGRYKMILYRVA